MLEEDLLILSVSLQVFSFLYLVEFYLVPFFSLSQSPSAALGAVSSLIYSCMIYFKAAVKCIVKSAVLNIT